MLAIKSLGSHEPCTRGPELEQVTWCRTKGFGGQYYLVGVEQSPISSE